MAMSWARPKLMSTTSPYNIPCAVWTSACSPLFKNKKGKVSALKLDMSGGKTLPCAGRHSISPVLWGRKKKVCHGIITIVLHVLNKMAGNKYETNINTKAPLYTNTILVSYQTFNTVTAFPAPSCDCTMSLLLSGYLLTVFFHPLISGWKKLTMHLNHCEQTMHLNPFDTVDSNNYLQWYAIEMNWAWGVCMEQTS